MDHAAEIKRLSVAFKTKEAPIVAVKDVSFELYPGETLALLGESGCGKSLTSLALMRLLPLYGVYGQQSEINYAGVNLLNLPEQLMRTFRGRRFAMIFQEPMTALNPVLTIGQQLSEALKQHQSLSQSERQKQMIALLNEVEMPHPERRLIQYPHQLSGGQKQRIVIAMALACNPEILIADEPTTALDVTIQAQILTLLKKLQARHQMSMLLITHDLTVVKATADRVCVMYAGQIVENATVDDFFKQPLHPYSQELLVSVPSIAKRGQRLHTIKGTVPTLDAMPIGCRFHPRCAHVFEPCNEIEPELQPIEQRKVRCHLYPEHIVPPDLPNHNETWAELENHAEPILKVNNMSVHFISGSLLKGTREVFKAVDDISFEIKKGKTLALVGESGCGKTTIARTIMQLQPITSGKILFHDEEVTRLKGYALRQFRKKVQIIFQDPYSSMNPRWTIDEILAEGMLAQGIRTRDIKKKQVHLLEQVNLPANCLSRYPHQFSGGQRQRICIARALATEPELLICDEPTSALDISVQAQIINLLKDLQQEQGLSYLFITHNMAVVAYLADEVLVMKSGKKVEEGSSDDIFQNPKEPYTRKLLESVLPN
ncbi:ABC transporter ATP-binding protein [Legionella impletisoli]|uniref:ABC-type dipeptide transporter n=1 Tax=Legionella impletisoli TaxID=343510 RepID=A0A917NB38_9GAMM|nr:ABC transporter ATP-binding protein [Legionella impletisoli]GGI85193.1 ABC transporter ATP-binding protein [Legionella impletisoli]